MLGSAGSIVPKRWILGIFALGLIAIMVATSANPWAGAAVLPTGVTAVATSSTSVVVTWTESDVGATLPAPIPVGQVIDAYKIDCVGAPGTVTVTVAGRATETANVPGLTAETAYVCSVFAKANTTLPASGVAAASITTPLNAATTLNAAGQSLLSANVQVGSTVQISVWGIGADVAETKITDGLTVAWMVVGSNGTLSDLTGRGTTYTATSVGTETIGAQVRQTASGIGPKSTAAIVITNFAVAADPVPAALVDPASSETPELPDVSGFEAGAAESAVLKPSSASTTLSVVDAGDSTVSGSVNFGAGAIPTNTSVGVLTSIGSATSATAAMPSGVTSVGSSILSISMTDKDGVPVGNSYRLNSDATISIQLPMSTVTSAGADTQGLSIWKATTEAGPWTTLSSTVTNVDGVVEVTGQVRTLSVFRIGFETRGDVAVAAVLPSAGDAAPTTTQALLVTGLGLLLIVGGGVYVRRQRRANGTV